MITVRKSSERGYTNRGWMNSYRTFSFEEYQNENHMHFRDLRVINEDIVQPEQGFPAHRHKNMEIITYVINGELIHEDNLGNSSVIHSNQVQRITAGKGIIHSEYNYSQTDNLHFIQIWIFPDQDNLKPGYECKLFSFNDKDGQLCLIASNDGHDNSLQIHQDVNIYASILNIGEKSTFKQNPDRYTWIQVIYGKLLIDDISLKKGDGVALSDKECIELYPLEKSEILLFDLK
ncbi:MAG: quercetin 2,3-dioxygenase [Candidatus Melainabacteria bacterium RIFOXYA12_FULL_32_12]|nr:MAG: quercetin 2,3-dioxygenase [Candidatus Melainabacteria bacterium RIFOXYA2_FULL_32_9]OGI26873.1 MAG: quercetin 2,3-dioxygenase [Candidatus Melainabacteria bacterium RIFOXYA12_FULL_32_12]